MLFIGQVRICSYLADPERQSLELYTGKADVGVLVLVRLRAKYCEEREHHTHLRERVCIHYTMRANKNPVRSRGCSQIFLPPEVGDFFQPRASDPPLVPQMP